jgi:hypothetical protein
MKAGFVIMRNFITTYWYAFWTNAIIELIPDYPIIMQPIPSKLSLIR